MTRTLTIFAEHGILSVSLPLQVNRIPCNRKERSCLFVGQAGWKLIKVYAVESGVKANIKSQLFIIPSIFCPMWSLIFICSKNIHFFPFVIPSPNLNLKILYSELDRKLNIPYSFSFLSRYSLFSFHPRRKSK